MFFHEFYQTKQMVSDYTTATELETLRQLEKEAENATEEWRITWVDTVNTRRIMKSALQSKEARSEAQYRYKDLKPAEQHFRRKKWAASRAVYDHEWTMRYANLRRKAKAELGPAVQASRKGDGELAKIVDDVARGSYESLVAYLEEAFAGTEDEQERADMLVEHLHWASAPGAEGMRPPMPYGVSTSTVLRHLRAPETFARDNEEEI